MVKLMASWRGGLLERAIDPSAGSTSHVILFNDRLLYIHGGQLSCNN